MLKNLKRVCNTFYDIPGVFVKLSKHADKHGTKTKSHTQGHGRYAEASLLV